MYNVFSNPFYYGEFEYPRESGNWYKGKHEPMVTPTEYDRVQIFLGRKGRPRPKSYDFAYRGLIKCGECLSSVTAEEKNHLVCSACKYKFSNTHKTACPQCGIGIEKMKSPTIRHYVYYHCTKKKNPQCRQKSLSESELEKQIVWWLDQLELHPSFTEWALKKISKQLNHDTELIQGALSKLRKEYDDCTEKLKNLADMRAGRELDKEEYLERKHALLKEKGALHDKINNVDLTINEKFAQFEQKCHFAETARPAFENGYTQDKKAIFAELGKLGSNFSLIDKKLNIHLDNELFAIKKATKAVKAIHSKFEPEKNGLKQEEIEHLYAQNPVLWSLLDDVRTFLGTPSLALAA